MLDMEYLLAGTPARMRHTYRWATSRVVHRENVAEHSWFAAFYSMMIAQDLLVNHDFLANSSVMRSSLLREVMEKALLHDLEECRTGDIHRPFKHSTPVLLKQMEQAAGIAMDQILEPLTVVGSGKDLSSHLKQIWRGSKDDTFAGRIVEFADFLCLIMFILEEGGTDPNSGLLLETFQGQVDKFEAEEYDFLRPYVLQVTSLIQGRMGHE